MVQNHTHTLGRDARFLFGALLSSTGIGSKHWRNGTNFALSVLNFEQIFIEMLSVPEKGPRRSVKFRELKYLRKWRIIKFDITYFLCFFVFPLVGPMSAPILSNFEFFSYLKNGSRTSILKHHKLLFLLPSKSARGNVNMGQSMSINRTP